MLLIAKYNSLIMTQNKCLFFKKRKSELSNAFIELDVSSVMESTEEFYKAHENRIPERSQGMAEQPQQHDWKRIIKEFSQQESPPGLGSWVPRNTQKRTSRVIIKMTTGTATLFWVLI